MEESDSQTGNVSDTESSMGGLKYTFVESLRKTNATIENTVNEQQHDDSDDVSSPDFQNRNKKLQKQKDKSVGKRHIKSTHVSKKVSLTKSLKNKGNQDLFGVQGKQKFLNKTKQKEKIVLPTRNCFTFLGNYNLKNTEQHSQDDAEQQQQQETEQCDTQQEAFSTTKSKKSFRNEKRQKQLRKSNAAVNVNSSNTNDVLEIRSLNSKRPKSKNPIVLKNVQSLRNIAANDSNETDI